MAENEKKSSSLSVGDRVEYEGVDLNGERGTFVGEVTDVADDHVAVAGLNGESKPYAANKLKKVE